MTPTLTMHPLLDPEKQKRARAYEKERRLLGLAGTVLSLAVLLAFYYSGASRALAQAFPGPRVAPAFLLSVAVLLAVASLVSLPLDFYSGYVREHAWGFSNQSARSWLGEKAKSFAVSLVIALIVLALLFWVMARFPREWWIIAGLGSALVQTVSATLYPVLILPLFNKYTPIDDPELTEALKAILERGGLKSGGFFKEDMSRQTKKENAFLAGLGRTRRVVLGDTLLTNMSIPEIVSVIAHEVGHHRHRHIWKGILSGTIQQVIAFGCLDLVMRRAFPDFLSSTRANLALLPPLAIILGALSVVIFGPLNNALSRHFERQADRYAVENGSGTSAFISAMAGLANRNLADAYPPNWVKLLYYSHPPIGERIAMAEQFEKAK